MSIHPSMSRSLAAAVVLATAGAAVAVPIPVRKVVAEGDGVAGGQVLNVGVPTARADGSMSCLNALTNLTSSVWIGSGEVFNSSTQPGWGGGSGVAETSDAGEWIYGTTVGGADQPAIVTSNGVMIKRNDPLPFDASRAFRSGGATKMSSGGTAFWYGLSTPPGANTPLKSHIMKNATPGNPAATVSLLQDGDTVSGETIAARGIKTTLDVSMNGDHYIAETAIVAPVGSDAALVINGTIVMREGGGTGLGDLWETWEDLGINNSGNYVVSGDTNGPNGSDDFVAYNGAIQVRAGDTVDGLRLHGLNTGPSGVRINNNNRVAMLWEVLVGIDVQQALLIGDGAALGTSSRVVFRTGDQLDVNEDGITDGTIQRIGANLFDLADNGTLYAQIDYLPNGATAAIRTIVATPIPAPGAVSVLGLAGLAMVRRRRA